jgi:hypothetical protein
MDKLKELLGEELYSQMVSKLGDTKILVDDGKLIPAHRLSEVVAEKKAALEQVAKYEKDMESLKSSVSGNEKLTQQITELQSASQKVKDEYESKMQSERKANALLISLMDAGVLDAEARNLLSKNVDMSKVELDESGKIKGIEGIVKPMKENKTLSKLFGEEKVSGHEHERGGNPSDGLFTLAEIEKFSQDQLVNDPKLLEKVNKSLQKHS